MDLLIAQFNNGPLSLEKIRTVLGQDQATWTVLSSKFKQDSDGLFYNERLAAEIEKRQKFLGKQLENGKKGGRPKNPEITQTETQTEPNHKPKRENENEIEIRNEDSFGKSENLLETKLSETVLEAVERNQFSHMGDRNTEFIKGQWDVFLSERAADNVIVQKQNRYRLGEYFINWMRTKFPKQINGKKIDSEKTAKIKKQIEEQGDMKI